MKALITILKHIGLGALFASIPLIGGCSDNTMTWQEEVKLLDGRMITVTQKRRYESSYNGSNVGAIAREAWLMFRLPEFDTQEIVWHQNLSPMVLNVFEGKLYVVGMPPTGREFDLYGRPKPPYIGFRYEAGSWTRIPFGELPEAIYNTNLLLASWPSNKAVHVSLSDKEQEMKDRTLPKAYKRIDPAYTEN